MNKWMNEWMKNEWKPGWFIMKILTVRNNISIVFNKISTILEVSEAATEGALYKMMFLKIWQYSQEITCVKSAGLQEWKTFNFIKRLRYSCFPVKIAKFLRTSANSCFWCFSCRKENEGNLKQYTNNYFFFER